MRVSVIIPTLNATRYMKRLIEKLQAQTVKPHEIIVIDSTSDDDTAVIAREMNVTVLTVDRKSFDHGGTRNYAASHATGDVFVFITQDALPSDELFIEKLIEPFEDSDVAAVYGRQMSIPDTNLLERMNKEFNYPIQSMKKSLADVKRLGIKTFFFTNVCSAVRSGTFQKVGGFPAPIVVNEDMILAARCILAGYTVAYAADARVDHSHNYTLRQTFTRYFDIGGSIKMNKWLLEYTSAEGEGARLLKTQLRQLIKPSRWLWIPRWIAESAVKYLGYRMGLAYNALPSKIRRKCSMHPLFWDKGETTRSM